MSSSGPIEIVAANAKLIADGVNDKRDTDQYTAIKRRICELMNDGKYYITVFEYIRPIVRGRLQKEGFRVGKDETSGANETSVEIHWS
jgi:hypothetical protein